MQCQGMEAGLNGVGGSGSFCKIQKRILASLDSFSELRKTAARWW
jgi:hypothetical protein